MPKTYFVTAIGTDSGKTIISAILAKALDADYWKPIQSGLEIRDTATIQSLSISTKCFDEAYLLKEPMSPHAAAKIDGVKIDLDKVIIPNHSSDLVIEGAGGLMVPLNDQDMIIDLIEKLNTEVVLVANIYLGSINHTLLSINELKRRNIPVKGIIFNGERNEESIRIILKHSGYRELLHVNTEQTVDANMVEKYAVELRKNW